MAVGLRIHYPDPATWGHTILIEQVGSRFDGKPKKKLQVRLDADGYAIVSPDVWEKLYTAQLTGRFAYKAIVVNEVHNPPTQIVGAVPDPFSTERRFVFLQDGTVREVGAPPAPFSPVRPPQVRR